MKKIILLSLLTIFFAIQIKAQNEWQKKDRQDIMDDGLSLIKKYDNIPQDKQKLIAKCYMDAITSTYTVEKYKNLIYYELETLKKNTIDKCAKDNGFDLEATKTEIKKVESPKVDSTEAKATKENLIGHWKDDESEFWLFETGDYKMQYNNGKSAKGTWVLNGEQLILNKEKFLGQSEKVFKILIYTKNKFVYQSLKDKSDTFTAVRVTK